MPQDKETENIFLFIPNLIGYARVLFVIASLWYMPLHPWTCCTLYSTSCLLDAFDGAAARRFNQKSRFGAVLDMVIDRCSTACLCVFLAGAFPQWGIVFQALISLDMASHYAHMFATAMGGQSHKEIDAERPWVLRVYYSNTTLLFTVCFLNEMFFIALYLLSSDIAQTIILLPLAISSVFMLLKQYINVIQLVEASKCLARADAETRRNLNIHRL